MCVVLSISHYILLCFLNLSHSLRIMLIVKVNSSLFSYFRFPCLGNKLLKLKLKTASRTIGRGRQILQVVSKMVRRVIEGHHSHLLIMIKSQRYVLLLNGNSQMEDGKRTFPVFGLLAQPTPSNLLLAQTTWQKFPVSPLL